MEMELAQLRHLSLSSRNPSAHILISLRALHSSSPTSEQDRFVRGNIRLLHPRVQVLIFHLPGLALIASLDLGDG